MTLEVGELNLTAWLRPNSGRQLLADRLLCLLGRCGLSLGPPPGAMPLANIDAGISMLDESAAGVQPLR